MLNVTIIYYYSKYNNTNNYRNEPTYIVKIFVNSNLRN